MFGRVQYSTSDSKGRVQRQGWHLDLDLTMRWKRAAGGFKGRFETQEIAVLLKLLHIHIQVKIQQKTQLEFQIVEFLARETTRRGVVLVAAVKIIQHLGCHERADQ